MFHGVPRLDRPNKFWLLPAPVAKWIGMGLVSGPLYASVLSFVQGVPQPVVWGNSPVFLVWLVGLVVGIAGAFVRPGGHDLARWANVLVNYAMTPKRAVWRPVGPIGG